MVQGRPTPRRSSVYVDPLRGGNSMHSRRSSSAGRRFSHTLGNNSNINAPRNRNSSTNSRWRQSQSALLQQQQQLLQQHLMLLAASPYSSVMSGVTQPNTPSPDPSPETTAPAPLKKQPEPRKFFKLRALSPWVRWNLDFWGWILFTISAILYGIASLRIRDWWNFSASMAFLVADFMFIFSYTLSPWTLEEDPTGATSVVMGPGGNLATRAEVEAAASGCASSAFRDLEEYNNSFHHNSSMHNSGLTDLSRNFNPNPNPHPNHLPPNLRPSDNLHPNHHNMNLGLGQDVLQAYNRHNRNSFFNNFNNNNNGAADGGPGNDIVSIGLLETDSLNNDTDSDDVEGQVSFATGTGRGSLFSLAGRSRQSRGDVSSAMGTSLDVDEYCGFYNNNNNNNPNINIPTNINTSNTTTNTTANTTNSFSFNYSKTNSNSYGNTDNSNTNSNGNSSTNKKRKTNDGEEDIEKGNGIGIGIGKNMTGTSTRRLAIHPTPRRPSPSDETVFSV